MTSLLSSAFVYLGAAVLIVPVSKRLGLGSVLGYLLAGILIGPIFHFVGPETHDVQHVAEFGVVMMLFLIGLELEPAMLWKLRAKLFGLGGLQVLLTIAVIAGCAMLLGQPWQVALAAGCVLALSSTAIVLQTLGEKGLLGSPGGQSAFSVLLFQDIAVIPMLALLPMLALPGLTGHAESHEAATLLDGMPAWQKAALIVAVIGGIVGGAHFLTRPFFRYIARSHLREIYTATALALVVGIAALMSLIGLSPALGAFVAGVVLADSEYRHELESTLEPFKGLLLGLFFITVGAGIDFDLLFNEFGIILCLTLAVMLVKAAVLHVLGKLFRQRGLNNRLFALSLAQAGEFGFVLLSFVVQNAVMPQAVADRLLLVVALSMLFTPLLFIVYEKFFIPRAAAVGQDPRQADAIAEENPIIILGHGRFGQIIDGLLESCGYHTTVIDYDVETVEGLAKYGIKTYFGDASRPELLEAAGIAKAQLLVVAIDNAEQATAIVEDVRKRYPQLPILARAYDRLHVYALYRAGAQEIVRETFDAAMRSGRIALEMLGMDIAQAQKISDFYYHRDRHSVRLMADAYDPDLPRFGNERMAMIAKADDAETEAMIAALLRGEEVDWKPEADLTAPSP